MNQIGCQDGDTIRRLREERAYLNRKERAHWSIKAFAGRIGITPQSLSNIELGNKPASIDVIIKIAREFGVPVDKILKSDEEEVPERAAA